MISCVCKHFTSLCVSLSQYFIRAFYECVWNTFHNTIWEHCVCVWAFHLYMWGNHFSAVSVVCEKTFHLYECVVFSIVCKLVWYICMWEIILNMSPTAPHLLPPGCPAVALPTSLLFRRNTSRDSAVATAKVVFVFTRANTSHNLLYQLWLGLFVYTNQLQENLKGIVQAFWSGVI